MLRRIFLGLLSLVLAAVLFALGGLFLAKRAIVGLTPPLPSVPEVLAFDPSSDLPVRLSWINTASQRMPRAGVLESSLDPNPKSPYILSIPAFVLEWSDGRIFLVDLGMDAQSAIDFGKLTEIVMGGKRVEPHGTVVEQLGDAVSRVAGVSFTHEHVDHTTGALELCRAHPQPMKLFLDKLWIDSSNYTTRPGLEILAKAKCLARHTLEGGPLIAIPGFPGLGFFAAAGHTPGSQVFVAHVRDGDGEGVKTWILAGDIANNIDGIRQNIPKPSIYSMFVVPESTVRLDLLRRFLGSLERDHGVGIVVSHDELALEASGIPKFSLQPAPP
ncbi:MAG TPA: MBL fold metallo-hydrolase [Myxococcota bacterium]|nr:MBL fold metallo-hydrolase [Myxococcota bacterium]